MRTRNSIKKLIEKKHEKIKQLDTEIIELNRESILLSDKYQQFKEGNEDVLICGRPKKYETKLIGKIYWKEDFIDEDNGEVFEIERNRIVRINGEWQ